MKIGVTASRHGMTPAQLSELHEGLLALDVTQLHHGDCVGGDAQAHQLARQLGIRTVGHPPTNSGLRAFCDVDEARPPKGYLARDRDLVDEVDLLVGGPSGPRRRGSGTWYTLDYADSIGRPFVVLGL